MKYADPAVATFIVIPLLLVAALTWGTAVAWRRSGAAPEQSIRAAMRSGLAAVIWMSITWGAAQSGILRNWDQTPPPFAFLVLAIVMLAATIAWSPLGQRLARFIPLWILVAVQSFRLPLELAMHEIYERGVMPVQMSYSGLNFDIVTGATAIIVSAVVWSGRGGRRLVATWNALGLLLLINIVTIAILATPRFRYFGDDALNTWVMDPPFVWLPAVMVLAALAGHLLIVRALQLQKAIGRL
ncbi:MAG TPA: hypothetical protein VNT79_14770 [Phycisphaerae bacterium]|nr:hypothetical protein [Phycisphaerae bacterium]